MIALGLSDDQTAMEKVAAKIRKRLGQVRRLGFKGAVRTAYIKTLGRTVQSSADYARSVARRSHRRRAHNRGIEVPAERLKRRLEGEIHPASTQTDHAVHFDFGTNRGRFVQVLEAIMDLIEAGCAVPRPIAVDWNTNAITAATVPGTTLRERTPGGPDLVAGIEAALLAIHRAGYVLDRVEEDSVLIADDGAVVVSGVGNLLPLAGLSRDMSVYLRDLDRAAFNRLFGTHLLTASYLRRRDSAPVTIDNPYYAGGDCAYASIVVRDDVHWGSIWNTDVGTARWDYILKDNLPIPQGGTVLDLGSNVGLNPLQMLRHGAASAVGIEYDGKKARNSLVLKAAFEWLDNQSYDFRCIQASFADLPSLDLGRFDVVTALCALYYLSEQEMRDLVAYIRSITDVLVLQCNTDRLIDRSSEETFRKASIEFAIEILEQARFAKIEVIAPSGYSRPLVIGSTP